MEEKMKNLLIGLVVVLSTVFLQATETGEVEGLREGTYEGTYIDGDQTKSVYLMLKPVDGRDGSFYGVLTDASRYMFLYLVDPRDGQYVFTPFVALDNGLIGMINDDPSHVLNMVKGVNAKKDTLSLVSSNSGNKIGFNARMTFCNCLTKKYEWMSLTSGRYYLSQKDQRGKEKRNNDFFVTVSNWDDETGTADASYTSNDVNGLYRVIRTSPYMYSLYANSVLATGTEVDVSNQRWGIFVKSVLKTGWFGSRKKGEYFFLTNPYDARLKMYNKK